jgi:hypothetical protein
VATAKLIELVAESRDIGDGHRLSVENPLGGASPLRDRHRICGVEGFPDQHRDRHAAPRRLGLEADVPLLVDEHLQATRQHAQTVAGAPAGCGE